MTLSCRLRVAVRLVQAAIWTCGMVALRLAALPTRLISLRFDCRCREMATRLWGIGICHIVGMRITVHGRPPRRPYILVSNHVSHTDSYLLAGLLGPTLVAKSEVRSWPIFGWIARAAGLIFVDRTVRSDALRVNELIGEALARDEGVAIFAESTTSRGHEIMPFKTALLEPAIQQACPVHYATIHYATDDPHPPASDWVCWWDGRPLSFGEHILQLLAYPGFRAEVTFCGQPISAPDRKALAYKLREAAQEQFKPIT